MSERDLFANFDRMRREMDELFGDMFERTGLARSPGGWPAVDVAYTSEPALAVVTADLAGIEVSDLELQIERRTLIIAGVRGPARPDGDVYQQVEIVRGAFRRVIELGADVRSEAAGRTLRGWDAAHRTAARAAAVPLALRSDREPAAAMIEVGVPADGAREVAVTGIRQLPDQIAVLPLRETVTFPEMPVPLNIGQARSIELVNDALRGDRSIVLVAGRDPEVEAPGPTSSTRSACSGRSRG